jgi:hypothetical protein
VGIEKFSRAAFNPQKSASQIGNAFPIPSQGLWKKILSIMLPMVRHRSKLSIWIKNFKKSIERNAFLDLCKRREMPKKDGIGIAMGKVIIF